MEFLNYISLVLILFFYFFWSRAAPYSTFARDATAAPSESHYDYIIVGGGTSGCGLAATLSEGSKVLLLERGGLPYGNPNISNINGFAATLSDTSPTSASQLFISTDGVFNHRARVLGGGSALNAGFYSRADPEFYNRVPWDPILVSESYEWVEKKVVFQPSVVGWQSAVKDGLLETGSGPYNGFTMEHLIGTKVGGTIFDATGHRHTAADLLEYAIPSSITVYLHATVYQILFITEGNNNNNVNKFKYRLHTFISPTFISLLFFPSQKFFFTLKLNDDHR